MQNATRRSAVKLSFFFPLQYRTAAEKSLQVQCPPVSIEKTLILHHVDQQFVISRKLAETRSLVTLGTLHFKFRVRNLHKKYTKFRSCGLLTLRFLKQIGNR